MADKPFAVLAVNANGYSVDELRKAMDKENLTWRSFADPREGGGYFGPICTQWNLSGTPTIFALDHKGVIRHKWIGGPGEKAIDETLEKLIKQAGGDGK
jgi:hypothetical protein